MTDALAMTLVVRKLTGERDGGANELAAGLEVWDCGLEELGR